MEFYLIWRNSITSTKHSNNFIYISNPVVIFQNNISQHYNSISFL